MNPNIASKNIIISSGETKARLYNQQIESQGVEVLLYGNFSNKELTTLGEVSYFTKRQSSIIKIMPAFDLRYAMMAFTEPGKTDELNADKQLFAYVKTPDNINVGDFIEVTYSYFENTQDRKFYKVDVVDVITPAYIPISKRITLSSYMLPIEILDNKVEDDYLNVNHSSIFNN